MGTGYAKREGIGMDSKWVTAQVIASLPGTVGIWMLQKRSVKRQDYLRDLHRDRPLSALRHYVLFIVARNIPANPPPISPTGFAKPRRGH